ncbi:MAG TPA: glyceraldehyde 3-phosphate dehydrogenase NAD-binding domain-containing protein [Candidatus Woesebacteria bacterium]|nr:glyceraldehyde 3-phosphate dehydrogenase NAD-binding domain-containing protein [Candidatus Woesebacteria bacterium]
MLNLAINGFGRIGRVTLRTIIENYHNRVRVTAINTSGSMDTAGWAHFLKYDTVYGRFNHKVTVLPPKMASEIGRIMIDEEEYPVLAIREPVRIPWSDYGVETVLECTGVFRDRQAEGHFKGGAKKVIISAPPKDESIPTFVLGVNEEKYQGEKLISIGSCTTNCVAPVVKLMDQEFGFLEAVMTTIHAYTASQQLVDGSSSDWREGRAAAQNLIPAGTGAAQSVVAAYPPAAGRFAAFSVRAPVVCGSYSTFVFKTKRKTTVDEVNQKLEEAAAGPLRGILKVSYEPLVSTDILGESASAIIDAANTEVLSDDLVYLGAWYDNEWGYSCRLVEMAEKIHG